MLHMGKMFQLGFAPCQLDACSALHALCFAERLYPPLAVQMYNLSMQYLDKNAV